MTNKQRLFVEYYLQCWNATKAAERAGYRVPKQEGSRLLSYDAIKEKIAERLAEIAMDADEVLARLADQARGEGTKYLTVGGSVDLARIIADDKQHLVKKVKRRTITDKNGNIIEYQEVEFHDTQNALVQLGRHHKLFTDRVESDERVLLVWDKEPMSK
ncbi:unnamed protein product [marine sediment metagenome]|uniref:Terminase small subunit n=1 Tax=marine sediment metagenome TaxID=412755 RepID=X0T7K7_9ZZZZ